MARKPRLQAPGEVRHVMSRGNGRMPIYLDPADHRQFEFLLGLVVEEYAVECWGFVGMSNHYHAILRPTRPNISDVMRKLNGDYGQWWNKRHSRVGHVFQGRFKDQIVASGEYLMTLIRYVARNPLRAALVNDLSQWRCGSYRAFAGLELAPPFLATEAVLGQFGVADTATLQSRFSAFVCGDRDDEAVMDRIRSSDRIIGDAKFKQRILEANKLLCPDCDRQPSSSEYAGLVAPPAP